LFRIFYQGRDCDPVRAFLTEYYEAAPGSAVATKDVYAHYTRWCSENGFQPMNSRNFGKNLRSVYPDAERRYGGASEKRYWMYTGIRPIENFGI
jgi:phage/plasmid-associated DNA primase